MVMWQWNTLSATSKVKVAYVVVVLSDLIFAGDVWKLAALQSESKLTFTHKEQDVIGRSRSGVVLVVQTGGGASVRRPLTS